MRAVIRSGLALSLSLGFASFAAAGIGVPHGTEICGEGALADDLPDPSSVYADIGTPALCEKLCRKTEATCRASVKDAFACVIRVIRFSHQFTKISCDSELDGQAEKDCKANSKEFWLDTIPSVKEQRALRLDDCADWGDVCRANSCD